MSAQPADPPAEAAPRPAVPLAPSRSARSLVACLGHHRSREEPAGGRRLDQRAGDPDRSARAARARPGRSRIWCCRATSAPSTAARCSPARAAMSTAWRKDIGAHVTKGEVLATISAPDLDQQLAEAKAQLVQLQAAVEQAQANADLGKVTDQRTAQLVAQGWSSKEQGDTDHLTSASRAAALAVAKANVVAQQAAVEPAAGTRPVSSRSRRRSTASSRRATSISAISSAPAARPAGRCFRSPTSIACASM